MKIIPIKTEYKFEAMNHNLKAVLVHTEGKRKITYFFDDKQLAERIIEEGSFWSDDDKIQELAETYFKEHKGAMSDLFLNHSDKVILKDKITTFVVINYGIEIDVIVKEEKGTFAVKISTANGENVLNGKFRAENASEALEKLRIFLNTMQGIGEELSSNIDELSNDRVMERIKW